MVLSFLPLHLLLLPLLDLAALFQLLRARLGLAERVQQPAKQALAALLLLFSGNGWALAVGIEVRVAAVARRGTWGTVVVGVMRIVVLGAASPRPLGRISVWTG